MSLFNIIRKLIQTIIAYVDENDNVVESSVHIHSVCIGNNTTISANVNGVQYYSKNGRFDIKGNNNIGPIIIRSK